MELATDILSWLVALPFLAAGAMKLLTPADTLLANENMAWIERHSLLEARIAGASEVMAAVTLILGAIGISFFSGTLQVVAAFGLALVMLLAAVRVHAPAGEPLVPNIVLGALALVLGVLLLAA